MEEDARNCCAFLNTPGVYALGVYFYLEVKDMENLKNLFLSIQDNLSFVLVAAAIVVALALIAKATEHFFKDKRKISPARRVSLVAMCAAVATVLHIFDFPLPFLAPTFYKLDFSELPVLLCSFYLGPVAGVVCEAVKILLKLLVKGTSTAFVGDFANFAVGCALVLPASICYHIRKTKKTAIGGLVLGTLVMTIFGSLFNAIYLLPKFAQLYGMSLESIVAMGSDINGGITSVSTLVLYAVVPLNLIKGSLVSLLTMLLYKRIEKPIFDRFK